MLKRVTGNYNKRWGNLLDIFIIASKEKQKNAILLSGERSLSLNSKELIKSSFYFSTQYKQIILETDF